MSLYSENPLTTEEKCFYCQRTFPIPVELHHSECECAQVERNETAEKAYNYARAYYSSHDVALRIARKFDHNYARTEDG